MLYYYYHLAHVISNRGTWGGGENLDCEKNEKERKSIILKFEILHLNFNSHIIFVMNPNSVHDEAPNKSNIVSCIFYNSPDVSRFDISRVIYLQLWQSLKIYHWPIKININKNLLVFIRLSKISNRSKEREKKNNTHTQTHEIQ